MEKNGVKLFVFLPINLNICFGCSRELAHYDGYFEYPQHMFWLRIKKQNNFPLHTLIFRPVVMLYQASLVSQFHCLYGFIVWIKKGVDPYQKPADLGPYFSSKR